MDPYQDIHNPQPQHTSLEKGIDHQRPELRVQIQKIVIVPDTHPGEQQQCYPDFKPIQDIEHMKDVGYERCTRTLSPRIHACRLMYDDPRKHAVRQHLLIFLNSVLCIETLFY
jgi:hypothetical protein